MQCQPSPVAVNKVLPSSCNCPPHDCPPSNPHFSRWPCVALTCKCITRPQVGRCSPPILPPPFLLFLSRAWLIVGVGYAFFFPSHRCGIQRAFGYFLPMAGALLIPAISVTTTPMTTATNPHRCILSLQRSRWSANRCTGSVVFWQLRVDDAALVGVHLALGADPGAITRAASRVAERNLMLAEFKWLSKNVRLVTLNWLWEIKWHWSNSFFLVCFARRTQGLKRISDLVVYTYLFLLCQAVRQVYSEGRLLIGKFPFLLAHHASRGNCQCGMAHFFPWKGGTINNFVLLNHLW